MLKLEISFLMRGNSLLHDLALFTAVLFLVNSAQDVFSQHGLLALARNQLAQMHCFAASNGKLAGMPSASCLRKLLMMHIPSIRSQVLMIFPSRLS